MKTKSTLILVSLVLMVAATAGFFAIHGTTKDPQNESAGQKKDAESVSTGDKSTSGDKGDNDEEAIESMAKAVVRNGRTFVILTKELEQRDGIQVAALTGTSEALTASAFGKVMLPQDLAADASTCSSAYSAYKAALSKKDASQKEYERLRTLNASKNISDKTFQAALAEFDADAAEVNSTSQDLQSAKTKLRQRWGPVVSSWLVDPPGTMSSRLLDTKDILIEASLPSGSEPLQDIRYGIIHLPGGNNVEAKYLSPAPSVNSDVQGPAYFFMLPANSSSVLPGMNVMVHISAGKEMKGVFVPSSAVVWLNGGTWVYVETAEDEFTRRAISTDGPVAGGFFVTTGLEAGERVVTKGAQLLLSQEFSSQIRAED